MEADVVCNKSNVNSFTSQNSKAYALFRQYFATLPVLLIYNLVEVSYNFRLTFLQVNVIKMFTVQ